MLETVQPLHHPRPREKIRRGGRQSFPRNQKHHRAGVGIDLCLRRGPVAHARGNPRAHRQRTVAPLSERAGRRRAARPRIPVAQDLHRLARHPRPAQGQAACGGKQKFLGREKIILTTPKNPRRTKIIVWLHGGFHAKWPCRGECPRSLWLTSEKMKTFRRSYPAEWTHPL